MRIKTFGSVIALSWAATAVVTACGNDTTVKTTEACTPTMAECVSEKVGRVCPDDTAPGWVYFPCDNGTICQNGSCAQDPTLAPHSLCTAGHKECVSDALSRTCSPDGESWVPLACAAGTVCDKGDCIPAGDAGGGVQVCNPGAMECATEYAVRTCQADGSDWVVTVCSSDELCQNGACVANYERACLPDSSQCLDESQGLRCRPDGTGYDSFNCDAATPCSGFKCMGPVCSPGETKCSNPGDEALLGGSHAIFGEIKGQPFANQQLYTCNGDGTGWDISACGSDELCVFNNLTPIEVRTYEDAYNQWLEEFFINNSDAAPPPFIFPPDRAQAASCQAAPCTQAQLLLGQEQVCGDPTAPATEDKAAYFSRCEGLAPFRTPQWVPYTCEAPTMCDPGSIDTYYGGADPCSTDCTPGESVCTSFFGGNESSLYNNDGVLVCNEQGEWEAPVSCNPGTEKALTCWQNSPGFGEMRQAQCVDPACAYLWTYYSEDLTTTGVCDGDDVRLCDADGMLADVGAGTACDTGLCSDWGNQPVDGRTLGSCYEECTDGEKICLDRQFYYYGNTAEWGPSYSPFYMQCEGGVWNRAPIACADEELCFQVLSDPAQNDSPTDVICGGECQPTYRQCTADFTGVLTCSAQGTWGVADDCDVGSCRNEPLPHNQFSDQFVLGPQITDAECAFDCVPGEYTATYNFYADAGTNIYEQAICGEDGRYGDYTRCEIGDQFNTKFGCYTCYGPDMAFYYPFHNEVDSTCSEDGSSILWCGDDNRWPTVGTDCGQGFMCDYDPYSGRPLCVPAPVVPDAGGGDASPG